MKGDKFFCLSPFAVFTVSLLFLCIFPAFTKRKVLLPIHAE